MDDYVVELKWSALSQILDPNIGSADLERIFNQCAKTISLTIKFGDTPQDYQVYPNSTVRKLKKGLNAAGKAAFNWTGHDELMNTDRWSELGVEDGATLSLVPLSSHRRVVDLEGWLLIAEGCHYNHRTQG